MAGWAQDLNFAYNKDGSRERIVHPDGAAFGYLSDALGRVTHHYELTAAPGIDDHVVRYWYNRAGNRSGVVRGAGAIGFYTVFYRDPVERLTLLANDFPLAADMVFELGYNPASQIVTRSLATRRRRRPSRPRLSEERAGAAAGHRAHEPSLCGPSSTYRQRSAISRSTGPRSSSGRAR
ncbi:MAG TPA: hypothetical protein VF605_17155 [Allosphingosinicella sp.]|jgi:hypothetical protein